MDEETKERILSRIKNPTVREHYRAKLEMEEELEAEGGLRLGGIFDVASDDNPAVLPGGQRLDVRKWAEGPVDMKLEDMAQERSAPPDDERAKVGKTFEVYEREVSLPNWLAMIRWGRLLAIALACIVGLVLGYFLGRAR